MISIITTITNLGKIIQTGIIFTERIAITTISSETKRGLLLLTAIARIEITRIKAEAKAGILIQMINGIKKEKTKSNLFKIIF